jgi:hypothetical protein
VITLLPKLTGTLASKEPSAAAVVLVTDAGAPVVVSSDATVTWAPGFVVPVTVVEEAARMVPGAGEEMLTFSVPGGPLVT